MAEGVGFGNYRLLRRIARGGMAEVFQARQQGMEGFERRVAIKRILPHLSDSTEFRTMFLDEARLAAQLTHPNIIHIYDFGKVDDYFYIAMEYVDGVDLGRLIKQARTSPVPFELIARTLADICAGLHYAHNITDGAGKRLNVVHRDVTPQNVLITYDGVVKVVDFGIAKATWQASRTRPGVVKGKYAYMSPEQVEGRSLDARSDVFSVGICMYELLTGMPLFRRDNVVEAMKEIRDGKPIRPETLRPDIPHEVLAVLKRALETSREQRYPTAAAMQLDLERYLKGAAGLATPQLLGDFLRREAPPGPPGETLVEGKDGEPVAGKPSTPAPAVATPQPQSQAGSIAVKGGTAPISSLKQAITPAYDSAIVNLPTAAPSSVPSAAPPAPSATISSSTEDLTTPGKHRPSVISSAAGPALGFDGPDDDLTRKEERLGSGEYSETTRSPKMTPPSGERPISSSRIEVIRSGQERAASKSSQERAASRSSQERAASKSGQERASKSQRSGQLGTPLGSYPDSEPRPALSADPTTLNELPKSAPRRRSNALVWLLLVGIGVAGGAYAARRYLPYLTRGTRTVADLAPHNTTTTPVATLTAANDLGTAPAADAAIAETKVITTSLPVQTSASIGIYTQPSGAKVFIDNELLDALTPIRSQPLTAGPHRVVIERVGCQPRELDVPLAPGEHRVLDFELPPERSLNPTTTPPTKKHEHEHEHEGHEHETTAVPKSAGNGSFTASTTPWSRVYEGGKLLGETPIVNVPMPAGEHTIIFKNPDIPDVKKKVVIKVGEETRLKVSLEEP